MMNGLENEATLFFFRLVSVMNTKSFPFLNTCGVQVGLFFKVGAVRNSSRKSFRFALMCSWILLSEFALFLVYLDPDKSL